MAEASHEQIIGGRYALFGPIASGGMAAIHFGRLLGTAGFARTVAIKRLHGEYLETPEVISTLLDEARLASRIRHPNVVSTLDMVTEADEVFLIMDYVAGETLAHLLAAEKARGRQLAPRLAAGIMAGVLLGLQAAHEATDESGEPLGIVHRDVSPQNILVGADGLARLLDFGIAKGKGRLQTTRAGQLKGKVSYMAPEQILGEEPDPRSDVYAAAVVLWEALTGQRLFPAGDRQADAYTVIPKILEADIEPPSSVAPDVPRVLDGIVMRGLNRERDARWESARAFAVALEESVGVATPRRIGEWVHELAADTLAKREAALRALEASHPDSQDLAGELLDATIRRRRKRQTSPGDTPVSGPGGVVADGEATPVDAGATPPDGIDATSFVTSTPEPRPAAQVKKAQLAEQAEEVPPNTRRGVPEAAVSSPVLSPRPPRDEELELRLVQHNEAQARAFEEARRAAEDRVNARRVADDQAREERSKAATVPDVSSVMRDAGIAAEPFASAPPSPVEAPIPSAPIPSAAPPASDDDALELPLAKSPVPLPAMIAIGVVVLIVVLWLALR